MSHLSKSQSTGIVAELYCTGMSGKTFERRPVVAYCTSAYCCWADRYMTKGGTVTEPSRVEKTNVRMKDADCPDCHSALFWEPQGKDPFAMTEEEYMNGTSDDDQQGEEAHV